MTETDAIHLRHLRHMAEVRPSMDGEAATWAVAELDRLREIMDRAVEAAARLRDEASEVSRGYFLAADFILHGEAPARPRIDIDWTGH